MSSPFVNAAGGNFHLASATTAGATLASTYNADPDGVTRGADGTWDRGAFDFVAGNPPSITVQPQDQSVLVGQTATFSVTATGDPTLTYQWKKNGSF